MGTKAVYIVEKELEMSGSLFIREQMDHSYVGKLKIDSLGETNWEGKSFLTHE